MSLPLAAPLVDLKTGLITPSWVQAFANPTNALPSRLAATQASVTVNRNAADATFAEVNADLDDIRTGFWTNDMPSSPAPKVSTADLNDARLTAWALNMPQRAPQPSPDPWQPYLLA